METECQFSVSVCRSYKYHRITDHEHECTGTYELYGVDAYNAVTCALEVDIILVSSMVGFQLILNLNQTGYRHIVRIIVL